MPDNIISDTPVSPPHIPPPQNQQDEDIKVWMQMIERRLSILESQAGTS
jgi:hypothetical protein